MKYFWSLSSISNIGVYAVLDIDTSVLSLYQANNDRVLQSWDGIDSPNTAHLYDWATSNGALPLVQCDTLAQAKGISAPLDSNDSSTKDGAVTEPVVPLEDEILVTVPVDVTLVPAKPSVPTDSTLENDVKEGTEGGSQG
jgi:hypothetical protein